jgi:alpha-ketoglutarate-dependent taurine dioxygenase
MSMVKSKMWGHFSARVANPSSGLGLILSSQSDRQGLSDVDAEDLRRLLYEYGVVVIRGCRGASREDFEALVAGLGPLAAFTSGTMVDLRSHSPTNETAFSCREMKFHQDGAPFARKSHYVGLYCETAPRAGEGGQTYFCFLRELVRRLPAPMLEQLRDLRVDYSTSSAEFATGDAGSQAQPCIITHPETGEELVYISLNNPADPKYSYTSKFRQLNESDSAALMLELERRMLDEEIFYEHVWEDGDCMIMDNLLVSHGRRAYVPTSKRRVVRVTTILTSPLQASAHG